MKKYFLLLILSLFAINISFAQNISLAQENWNPARLVSKYYGKFIGTWKYETADYSITITFTKVENGGIEFLFGTYQLQKNGHFYEDLSGKAIAGGPIGRSNPETGQYYNSNEIAFNLFDYKYFKGSNEYSFSQFILTMQEGYTDRAVLTRISEEDPRANVHRKRFRPTGNLLPPDGTVLIKQPDPQ